MTTTTYHTQLTVDNPLPSPPDLSSVSPNSRIGRKIIRKALDAYHVALRKATGRPAQSGPPIPNSEHKGKRNFYTLRSAVKGGIESGKSRRAKAAPWHKRAFDLARQGRGVRQIARELGKAPSTVSRVLRGIIRTACKLLPKHLLHPSPQPQYGARMPTLLTIYAQREPEGRRKVWLEKRLSRYIQAIESKNPIGASEIIKAATRYAEHLRDMPVDIAIRTVNGWYWSTTAWPQGILPSCSP